MTTLDKFTTITGTQRISALEERIMAMLNRFRKMLSILCVAALLLSCLPASFAEPGEIPEETQLNESGNTAETPAQEGEGMSSVEPPAEDPKEGSSEEPATEPETPAAETPAEIPDETPAENPSGDPAGAPAEPAAEPVTEPTEPADADPVNQPVDPADTPAEQPATEPAEQPAEPAEESVEQPTEPAAEPVEQPVEPVTEPEEAAEPAEEPAEQTADPAAEPVEQPAEPVTEPEEATEPAADPVEQLETPVTEPEAPAQSTENESQVVSEPEQINPVDEKENETEQPAEPAESAPTEPEQPAENAEEDKPEKDPLQLRLGNGYLKCPLKANETYQVWLESKWNRTIRVTLILEPKEGETIIIPDPDSEEKLVQVWFGDEEVELTQVENEDPEFKGLTFHFFAYIENGKTYTFTLLSNQDLNAGLHAIKKPEPEEEKQEIQSENNTQVEDEESVENTTDKDEKQPQEIINIMGTPLADAEMLEMGYCKVQVVKRNGADVYGINDDGEQIVSHCEYGRILWVKETSDQSRAEIYHDTDDAAYQIQWDDLLIVSQKEESSTEGQSDGEQLPEVTEQDGDDESKTDESADRENDEEQNLTEENVEGIDDSTALLPRSLKVTSSIQGKSFVPFGEQVTVRAELINFRPDDVYTCQWQYASDGVNYQDVEGATDLEYTYEYTMDNYWYSWRIVIVIDDSAV